MSKVTNNREKQVNSSNSHESLDRIPYKDANSNYRSKRKFYSSGSYKRKQYHSRYDNNNWRRNSHRRYFHDDQNHYRNRYDNSMRDNRRTRQNYNEQNVDYFSALAASVAQIINQRSRDIPPLFSNPINFSENQNALYSDNFPSDPAILDQNHTQDWDSANDDREHGNDFVESKEANRNAKEPNENRTVVKIKQESTEEESNENIPKISLVPLPLLLKEEYTSESQFEKSDRSEFIVPDQSNEVGNSKPNVNDPEKISKRLLNRVVRMDKTDIKNVINNPTSKFDTALKMHARKKLREEIRKQLRNVNLATSANNVNDKSDENLFQPDESIDCGQIPEAILNEISKSLGIGLLAEAGLHDENYLAEIDATSLLSAEGLVTMPSSMETTSKQQDTDATVTEKYTTLTSNPMDLMAKIKNFEVVKGTSDKVSKNDRKSAAEKGHKEKSTEFKGTTNVNTSSSSSDSDSSSGSESSSSGSDTSSNNDSSSDSNSTKTASSMNKTKKKKILESNVITHFNTLVLPIMPEKERQKYEKKTFKSNADSLLYVLDYCFKKTEENDITLTSYRKRTLRKNLKSRNNEEVLQFLMQKIKEMFEENKSKRKNSNSKAQTDHVKNSEKKSPDSKQDVSKQRGRKRNEKPVTPAATPADSSKQPQITSNCNKTLTKRKYQKSTTKISIEKTIKLPTKNAMQSTIVDCDGGTSNKIPQIKTNPIDKSKNTNNKSIQQCNSNPSKDYKGINKCKELVTTTAGVKVAQSATNTNTDNRHQKGCGEIIQSTSDNDVDGDYEKTTTNVVGSKNKGNETAICNGNSISVETITKQCENRVDETEVANEENKITRNEVNADKNQIDENRLIADLNEFQKTQRSWKSPGEKKCIQLSNTSPPQNTLNSIETQNNHIPNETNQTANSIACNLNSNADPFDLNLVNSCNIFDLNNQTESLKIMSLIQQNKISDAVLNNLKEIDLKLMELHKRKMYIEEMILKLQKDKMSIDLSAMQLQNEKFFLINAALSNNSNSCLNASQLQTIFNIKSEPTPAAAAASNFSATDLMANLLSETNEQQNTCQRKRKIVLNKSPSSSEEMNSKRNCQESHKNSSNLSEEKSDSNSNVGKPTQSNNNSQKKRIENKEKSSPDNSQMASTCRKMISNEKIVRSSENFSTNINFTESKIENAKNKCSFIENSIENVETTKNSKDDYDESSDGNDEKLCGQQNVCNFNDISNGFFDNSKFPITQMQAVGNFVIAACEDGNIYKFCLKTRKLLLKFPKHTEAVTEIFVDMTKFLYSISLDGFLKKTSLENFGLELQSKNLQEPLQCIDLLWNTAFIGSRWGNVFTYNAKNNKLSETLLCSVGSAIMALKATKEGARKILIVSSKGNQINFRDATSGLLLRTIQIPDTLNVYSILLDGDLLYCGSNKNEIHAFNFTTGAKIDIFICGNGAVSMKLYKRKFIFVGCYDGFVYVLDKINGSQIGRFPGAGKMILALDIIGEKLITSSKDNCMEIRDVPKYISALLK